MSKQPNLLIVSDLHLSRGYYDPQTGGAQGGHFSDLEDFFCDEAFFDFVAHHIGQGERWQLVLNGDVVDFLQVVDFPNDAATLALLREKVLRANEDWATWEAERRKFGLSTTAIESSWKLKQIAAGHRTFFLALAYVLATGSEVIVVSGNHDIEWHWPLVQRTLRELLREAYDPDRVERLSGRPAPAWRDDALDRLLFCPRFYYVKGLAYIEHGCQYEPSSSFSNMFDPVLSIDKDKPPEQWRIELPLGSFFVIYFFNQIEKESPFADNVKPISRYFQWVLRHQTAWMIKTLLTQWEVIWVIVKRVREIHRKRVSDPSISALDQPLPIPDGVIGAEEMSTVRAFVNDLTELEKTEFKSNPPILYLNFWQTLKAMLGFKHDFLLTAAQKIHRTLGAGGQNVRYVVFGHDHNADVHSLGDGGLYLNTGTWVPIQGEQERFFREMRELTYVKIVPGAVPEAELWRWSEGPRRGERVILMTEPPKRSNQRLWGWALIGAALLGLAGWWWKRRKRSQ